MKRSPKWDRWIVWTGLSAALAAPVGGATVVLNAVRDNTLYEDAAGATSNGAGDYLFAGRTDQPKTLRAVLAFDVAGAVPAGMQIMSARLTLEMSRTIAGTVPVELRRLTADWGEGTSDAAGQEGVPAAATLGDATWMHRFWATTTWTTPGGDFAATASALLPVTGNDSYTWGSTAQMESDVQGWLDVPASNFGWILLGDESANITAKRFNSRENSATATVPKLEITYFEAIFRAGFEAGDTTEWDVTFP